MEAASNEETKRAAPVVGIKAIEIKLSGAGRLRSEGNLVQMLLGFGEGLDHTPVKSDDVPPHTEQDEELLYPKRRNGRLPRWRWLQQRGMQCRWRLTNLR